MGGYWLSTAGKYQSIEPDEQGRLLSETTNIWFSVEEDSRRLRLKDGVTGEWLLTAKEERARRLEAETRVKLLEQRLQELLDANE